MERDIIISIKHVSKEYSIGEIGATTLQHELQSWWARKRGREDPNRRIVDRKHGTNGRLLALDDINLDIYRGEAIGIIGENGAGKSTLLKLLSQITAPTRGTIDIYGRITSMLEIGTGFDGEMTGRENIYLNGAILGMKKEEIDERLEEIIRFSELEEFIDTPVKRYSSGMYTKLGFSVAAHLNSEIMIMDEVLAVGDAAFQNKCIAGMKAASEQDGRTVLCVSHNMNQIRRLCDRCVVLKKGRIRYVGDVSRAIEIYMNESLDEEAIRLNYRSLERPSWLRKRRIRVTEAEYLNLESVYCPTQKDPRIRLKWDCLQDVQGLSLRVEFKDVNDQRLGTYVLYDICSCDAGRRYQMDIELDVSPFVPATYRTVYCFFVRDLEGNNQNEDRVPGLSLICEGDQKPGRLRWDAREWGYFELKGCSVLSLIDGQNVNPGR